MHLSLIRHADALPAGGAIRTDADRPLTAAGDRDARLIGRLLAAIDPGLESIFTSPLTRAIQTGARIAEAFDPAPDQRVMEHLAPGFRPKALIDELLASGSDAHIALIGHQPDMGSLLCRLVAGGTRAAVAFPPGSIAFLTAAPMGQHIDAQLRWMLPPELAGLLLDRMKQGRTP